MARKKPPEPDLIRLSNGVVETKKSVGDIVLPLRTLAVNHPTWYETLVHFAVGKVKVVPKELYARLLDLKFLDDTGDLYDDVKDVVECCAEWTGERVRFETRQLYHPDQTDLVLPNEED